MIQLWTQCRYICRPISLTQCFDEGTTKCDFSLLFSTFASHVFLSEFYVQLVMEMTCTPAITEANISDAWLDDFQSIVTEELLQVGTFSSVYRYAHVEYHICGFVTVF